jgi:hypothetical protein
MRLSTAASAASASGIVVPRMGDVLEKIWPIMLKKARIEAYALQYNFCRIVSVYTQLGI